MDNSQIFKKYKSKLILEGVLKSLIIGFLPGFALSSIAALITFFVGYNGLWLSVGICLITAAVIAPLFYFLKYRPSTKNAAERLDRLGLDERLITMIDLKDDESYIAFRQREDAKEKLYKRNPQVKFYIKKSSVILLAAVAFLSVSMTVLSVLGAGGIVPHPVKTYSVNYEASEGGEILGEAKQTVEEGKNAALVVAVATDGYVFEKWSDNLTNAERADKNIHSEITITAIFVRLTDIIGDNGSDEFDVQEPKKPGMGGGGDKTEDGPGGSGKYTEYNYFLDGETYYRDYYEEYYNLAMQMLAEGGEIPQELRAFIEAYFDIII